MNLHERGKRLSARVTGWIGVAAVIAASAIGLHTWADVQATKAQANSSAYTPAGSGGSDDEGWGDDGSESDESDDDGGSSQQSNVAPGQLVLPGNGGPSQATTSGS